MSRADNGKLPATGVFFGPRFGAQVVYPTKIRGGSDGPFDHTR